MSQSSSLSRAVFAAGSAAIALAGLALFMAFATPAMAAPEETGRYIVVFEDSVQRPGKLAQAHVEQSDGNMTAFYGHALDGYAATLPRDEVDALRRDPRVDYVTVDHQVTLFDEEVSLESEGGGEAELTEATTPTGIDRVFATANARFDIDGVDDLRADVDVAVLDTGIDPTHPDLDVEERTDCTSGTCIDNTGTDVYTHGTHVAGTIGAIDGDEGVVGVAPGARLWATKVLDDNGEGFESWVVAGVDWVTAHAKDIEVANMSLGCQCSMPSLEEAIDESVAAGVVYVVAAGNKGVDAESFSPAKNPNVITVSALTDYDGKAGGSGNYTCDFLGYDDYLAFFSNYGTAIDVAAPGVCILSTLPVAAGEYGFMSGTSMAAPHVSGAAAVLAVQDNPATKADVEAIRQTIAEEGNLGMTDISPDEITEPLLDVSDESAFSIKVDPPTNTVLPQIGPSTPVESLPVWATEGTWTGKSISLTYQWKRCNAAGGECASIGGATSSSYIPVEADVGKTLRIAVTAKNFGGETTATSNATNPVKAAPEPHWSDTESGAKLSGSVTISKPGASPKSCSPKGTQAAEFNKVNWVSVVSEPTDLFWFKCTTGSLEMEMDLYAESGGGVRITGSFASYAQMGPWGSYYTQAKPIVVDFANGSGGTSSTMTFSGDTLGVSMETGKPTYTIDGTLKVTTASGGLLTAEE